MRLHAHALSLLTLLFACGDEAAEPTGTETGSATAALTCPVVVSEAACDKSLRPIVFIHGTMGAADNAEHIAMLFGSNGYCQERFVAVDYNSLGDDPRNAVDALITKVLADTGQTKVDLMGHSQGARWGYDYVADAKRAERVANYIHLAGRGQPNKPSGVRTMSIASKADATGTNEITGADKIVIEEKQDHMGVAMSSESFGHMFEFLLGRAPQYTEVQCGDEQVTLLAKVASFGDNVPMVGATAEFWELSDDYDPRKRAAPAVSQVVGADGVVGPMKVRRGVPYEGRLKTADGRVVGHMYTTPWKRSDYLVRSLVPSSSGITSAVTNQLPKDDNQTVLVARYNQSALRTDLGHTLKIDGVESLVPALTDASQTTVGYFLWDTNTNGASELTPNPFLSLIPFVKGADFAIPAAVPKLVTLEFNDGKTATTVKIPNWPSASEGPIVVMFQ
ncbi:MAG: hypothetical protein ABW352_02660 [Polyangiales bacterium]